MNHCATLAPVAQILGFDNETIFGLRPWADALILRLKH